MNRELRQMADAAVLVVGDLILDRYWHGATRRISPEAPVPIVHVEQTEERVGGAANVAANVAALGADATLIGIAGADPAGERIEALARGQGVRPLLVRIEGVATIVKVRVVSQHQQLVRADFEHPLPGGHAAALQARFEDALKTCNVVVLSDYAKGTLSHPQELIARARAADIPVIVDPKGTDFERYAGATLLTPNLQEFEAVVGACADDKTLVTRAAELVSQYKLDAVLVTRGDAGMTLVERGGQATHIETEAHDVFDVTGAGDTVCGVLAAAIGGGARLPVAMKLANAAAGLVVGKFGAAAVSRGELEQRLIPSDSVERGVIGEAALLEICSAAKRRGERLVMTNGCFDILHRGHVSYLSEARALGDRLIVAVNDDNSVRLLKGNDRPVNPLESRMAVLAALSAVDWVVPFSDPTPRALISRVKPDVLVKGGDYRVDEIAGSDAVQAAGGRVEILQFVPGYSTTDLLQRTRTGDADS